MSRITDRAKFPIANFRSSGIHDDATSNTLIITNDNITLSSNVGISGSITTDLAIATTGYLGVPVGNTSQRVANTTGHIRFNTTLSKFEGYDGSVWGALGGGATGGGADAVFYENDQTVLNDYTITSGKNAMTAGPVTIDDGVTVTIPTGSRWVVV